MSSTRFNHQLNKTFGQLYEEKVKKFHDITEDDIYIDIISFILVKKMKKSHPAFSVSIRDWVRPHRSAGSFSEWFHQ